jgi:hypothetical protein
MPDALTLIARGFANRIRKQKKAALRARPFLFGAEDIWYGRNFVSRYFHEPDRAKFA